MLLRVAGSPAIAEQAEEPYRKEAASGLEADAAQRDGTAHVQASWSALAVL